MGWKARLLNLSRSMSSAAPSPPAPVNPWSSLTIPELTQIRSWLEAPEQNLNLTQAKSSKTSDNIIFLIEAYYPAKEDALAYLSNPVPTLLPERYARVTIHHGGRKEPVVKDYLVGPLPISRATRMRELTEIYHTQNIPFNARGVAQLEELSIVLAKLMEPMADVLQELFGATARGLANDTLVAGMSGPFSFDGSFRRLWMTWRRNYAGSYLLPVNFYQYLDVSGTDPSQWKILKHIYHGQVFDTADAFLAAFHNGTLVRHPEQADPALDLSWTARTRRGRDRDLDHRPGPRSVSFAGLRYRVDRARQHVAWLGWEMFLGFDRDMGLGFWDIRFRGERIIYQLSPQEAIAQYGGNDPLQATTAWLDRHFGMGSLVRNMIPYYDCPQEATFLPATTHTASGTIHVERAICIFEQDTGKPLTRHFGYAEGEFGAVKSYVLTVRSTTTFDYLFHLDGTIEVRLSASGYMQGGYWNAQQDGYGARIHETSMGNLHDHVINYKVDFDIAGTANSLLKTTTNQEEVIHPWLDDDWGQRVIQQKISKEYITNENDALLKYPANFQGGYAVVNQNATNAWGYPRGYAVHPGYNAIHNTVVGSKRLLNNANWARYNLAVSRRKETEPASSSMWNLHLPGAPTVDFHKFFDGENITQEDLVAWINLGMHHLPQAEDSPHTKTNIATSSFVLTPLNYFDYDISMELRNAILLHSPQTPGDPYTFDDYGVKQDFTCVPGPPSPFEYPQSQIIAPDGSVSFANSPEARRDAEMYFRVRIGA
ncbi:copper amine oxidase [Pholiota molesta]|nr:copper amine oxidase [Pholiota molesta]